MSALEMAMWWALLIVGFAGSAMFSGLETGAYSINRVRLHIFDQQNVRNARALVRMLHRPTALLTTLLIGNNIVNYMGTASLAVLLEAWGLSEWETIILNTLIITPMLFIFGETLPKDLFSAYSDRLMYPLTPVLVWAQRLFTVTGLLPLINAVTSGVFRLIGEPSGSVMFHPRRQVEVLVKEGVGHGLLSDEQSAIVERVMALTDRRVGQEMVAWDEVITLRLSDDADAVRQLAERTSRSRFPVVDDAGRVTGMVDVMDALLSGPDSCPPVRELQQPVLTMDANEPLRDALAKLQKREHAFAVVMRQGRPVGIVTIKDLVEPITGELTSW